MLRAVWLAPLLPPHPLLELGGAGGNAAVGFRRKVEQESPRPRELVGHELRLPAVELRKARAKVGKNLAVRAASLRPAAGSYPK